MVAVCTQTGTKYIVLEASLSIQDASNQDPSLAKHVDAINLFGDSQTLGRLLAFK